MKTAGPITSTCLLIVALSLVALFGASCVTSKKDLLYLNDQIVALNDRVNRLQKSTEAKETRISGDVDEKIVSLRERDAQTVADLDRLRTEIQALTGRVEENGYLLKRSVERDTSQQDAMRATLADLQKRTADLEERLKQIYEYLGLDPASDLRAQTQARAETQKKTEPKRPEGAEQEKPVSAEMDSYNQTLAAYREGNHEKAILGFKDFLKKYPNSELGDNAQFWIGEAYMALKQYEQAILAYQEVIKNYPKGNKVPGAMLRQAIAFQELNDKISARLLFKKVLKDHPASPEAKIAQTKLEAIK